MATQQNFRSAFNGFNREDVVHYLEYLNTKNAALVNQLTEEAEGLRQKLSTAAAAISSDSARAEQITALEAERDELKAQLEDALRAAETSDAARMTLEAECVSLRERLAAAPVCADSGTDGEIAALRQQLAAEQAKCLQLEAQLQQAKSVQPVAAAVPYATVEKELEAYRRAERIERRAQERAQQVYHQTNGVLADATARVDQVAADIGGIADQVLQQLQQLQQAVSGSKQALQDAAGLMYTIRPENEED